MLILSLGWIEIIENDFFKEKKNVNCMEQNKQTKQLYSLHLTATMSLSL